MRLFATIVTAAFLGTACAEPSADETADGIDTVATVATTQPAGDVAPAPDDAPDRVDESDTPDAPADDPAGDTADDPAGDTADDPAHETGGDVAASIPTRFHGEWNADLDACGTGQSPTRLRIGADQLRFYESSGVVQAVEIVSDRVINVTAEYQGEGDTWQDERRLSLSADGNSLTVSGGGDLVRYRCP